MLVLGFPDYLDQAKRLAGKLGADFSEVSLHSFPDGESLVRLPPALPNHVVLCRSLDHPNEKLIEMNLCAKTARNLGAKRLTLVAPYLCYMRQDIENEPGEAVSQRIIGRLLADLFDDVITVDPHLHRISDLREAIPIDNAISLTAAHEIANYLKSALDQGILLGPDSESKQWVANVAGEIGFDYIVADKIRHGDRKVEITLPGKDFSRIPIIIIDDIASTGRTISKTLENLHANGVYSIHAFITHPLFCGDAEKHLQKFSLANIWSTDTISHATNVVKLDSLLADGVRSIL